MGILFYTAGFVLLGYTFIPLWLEERNLTTREIFSSIGRSARR